MSWADAKTPTENANPTGINQYTQAAGTAHDLSKVAEGLKGTDAVLYHRTAEVAHRVAMDHARKLGLHNEATLHEGKARDHASSSERIAKDHPVALAGKGYRDEDGEQYDRRASAEEPTTVHGKKPWLKDLLG